MYVLFVSMYVCACGDSNDFYVYVYVCMYVCKYVCDNQVFSNIYCTCKNVSNLQYFCMRVSNYVSMYEHIYIYVCMYVCMYRWALSSALM